ncbi:hypothetical protein [Lentilactobacillus hilgardii]|uniref:hypothetical protein n=1 Tax=Lentilactobacillus hilgardii TaxID=1588 RepID=UPI0039ECA99A
MVNGAIIDGKELFANADTGWQDAPSKLTGVTGTGKVRIQNNILYIFTNYSFANVQLDGIVWSVTDTWPDFNNKYELPNITMRDNYEPQDRGATVFSTFQNGDLHIRVDNTDAITQYFKASIPLDFKKSGGATPPLKPLVLLHFERRCSSMSNFMLNGITGNIKGGMLDQKLLFDNSDTWHFLKTKDVGGDFDITMLYFKNYDSDYIRIIFLADRNVPRTDDKTYNNYRIVVDMSKIITSFSKSSSIVAKLSIGGLMTGDIAGTELGTANFVVATISGTCRSFESVIAATDFSSTGSLGDFRGIDFKVNGFI